MAANKTDLANAVQELLASKDFNVNKKESVLIVDSVIDSIIGLTGEAEKLQLMGFGTFTVKERAERNGRNPSTNEPMTIPAKRVPKFKAGKAFEEFVL